MPTPPAYLLPAMQAFRSGDMAGALAAAETALGDHPDDLPLLALASLAALQLASPERAIAHLRTHHALAPSDNAVKANLATALAETGARDEALALAQGSTHHALARLEGFLHQEAGDNSAAMIAYERAVMAKPGDMQSWNNLGNLRAAEGDTDGAVVAFEKAITLAPNQLDIYLNLSEVLSRADRQAARLVTTSAALVQAPDDIDVLTEHGITLVANDRHIEAVDILQSAVDRLSNQQQPQIHLAHIELAVLLETLNRIPELEALVTRCEADGIADNEIAFLKAWMLRRIGDYEAAWQFAKDIPNTINPVRTAQLQADIADRLGDTDRAFAEFTRMNELAVAESGPPPCRAELPRTCRGGDGVLDRRTAGVAIVGADRGWPPRSGVPGGISAIGHHLAGHDADGRAVPSRALKSSRSCQTHRRDWIRRPCSICRMRMCCGCARVILRRRRRRRARGSSTNIRCRWRACLSFTAFFRKRRSFWPNAIPMMWC